MARKFGRAIRFSKPGGYVFNMLVFLLIIGAVVYYLSPFSPQPSQLLVDAFNANIALNGIIIFVLVVGIIFNLRQPMVIGSAVNWVESFQEAADSSRARLPREPSLIRGIVSPLMDWEKQGGLLNPATSRAMLDSIGTRMDEGREMGRYISNLLVFLGLLGTFWGLLQTVNSVADTISGLANTGGAAEDAIGQLIANLREPLSGMGTAFSSSLFGLGGSLIIGFLDLQAGQAQNRFYSDLEDYLSGISSVSAGAAGGGTNANLRALDNGEMLAALQSLEAALAANTETQIKAQSGQSTEIKEEIRALNRTLVRLSSGE
ncbi:MAG: flagellar motor protein MotA [Pseudomonadota bacterium]